MRNFKRKWKFQITYIIFQQKITPSKYRNCYCHQLIKKFQSSFRLFLLTFFSACFPSLACIFLTFYRLPFSLALSLLSLYDFCCYTDWQLCCAVSKQINSLLSPPRTAENTGESLHKISSMPFAFTCQSTKQLSRHSTPNGNSSMQLHRSSDF